MNFGEKLLVGSMAVGLMTMTIVLPIQKFAEDKKAREWDALVAENRKRLSPLFDRIQSLKPSPSTIGSDKEAINNFLLETCSDYDKSTNKEKCFEWETIQGDPFLTTDQRAVIKAKLEEIASIESSLREAAKARAIADGSYQPDEFEVGRPCKELAKENSLTKDVDWGLFGGANSKWFPQQKTIILEGKTKNAFGVEIPFTIECRWEKGGVVRLVEIGR